MTDLKNDIDRLTKEIEQLKIERKKLLISERDKLLHENELLKNQIGVASEPSDLNKKQKTENAPKERDWGDAYIEKCRREGREPNWD